MNKPRHQSGSKALYSPEQRKRRDSSKWTLVQGVLAAFQFIVFLVSLALVLRTLGTGEGAIGAAEAVRETWRALEEFNLNPSLALEALFIRAHRELVGARAMRV